MNEHGARGGKTFLDVQKLVATEYCGKELGFEAARSRVAVENEYISGAHETLQKENGHA